jgi:hypothetical protein
MAVTFASSLGPTYSVDIALGVTELVSKLAEGTGAVQIPKLRVGAGVGRYELVELRSSGGFGDVYRAVDDYGHDVAIKVLHPVLSASPNLVRRFAREAELVAQLSHPNIVKLIDVGELDDGRPYLVMEWIDGTSLAEALRARGRFTIAETFALARELCAALEAAHASGIVHRDLKSANIMICPRGESFDLKLVDWGIAKVIAANADTAGLTTTGRMGTPHCMAPEQIVGASVDVRTDVYALGVLLYELMCGRPPFHAATSLEIADMHLRQPPPRPSDIISISPDIEAVVMKCLEKQREDRFPSVAAVLTALERAMTAGRFARASQTFAQVERGMAIHIEARIEADDSELDDELLICIDDTMQTVRDALAAEGLELVQESATSLLFVTVLRSHVDDPQRRAAFVARIRELAGALHDSRIALHATVHVAQVLVQAIGGRREYVGGKLLDVTSWVADASDQVMSVTANVLAAP